MVYKPFAGVRCICPAVEDIGHVCNAKQGIKKPAQLLLATSVADSGALGLTTAPPPYSSLLVLRIQSDRLANGFFGRELPRERQNDER